MSKTGAKGSNFFLLMYSFLSLRRVYTQSRCSLCCFTVFVPVNMSSNHAWTSMLIQSWRTQVSTHWNVEGALQSPCCITLDSNIPYGRETCMLNTVRFNSDLLIHIC